MEYKQIKYRWNTVPTLSGDFNVNADFLNKYLSDNMKYLKTRPRHMKTQVTGGNIVFSSGTWAQVGGAYVVRLDVGHTADVLAYYSLNYVGASNLSYIGVDVEINATTYASTGTATPATNGLQAHRDDNQCEVNLSGFVLIPNISLVGANFVLVAKLLGGTSVTINNTTSPSVLKVMEV